MCNRLDTYEETECVSGWRSGSDEIAWARVLGGVRARGVAVPLSVALRVTLDVLAVLQAFHERATPRGSPHGAVCPRAVYVRGDGASVLTALPSEPTCVSAGAYAAPETLRGESGDRRIDLYAAGVQLWEMIAGRPWEHGVSLRQLDPTLPLLLDVLCACACAEDPSDRYPSAAHFAADLAREFGSIMASRAEVREFACAMTSGRDALGAHFGAELVPPIDALTSADTVVEPMCFDWDPRADVTERAVGVSIPPVAPVAPREAHAGSSPDLPALVRVARGVQIDLDRASVSHDDPAEMATRRWSALSSEPPPRPKEGGAGLAMAVLTGVGLGLAVLMLAQR
jgi:hypothetical protein